jgi:hypothetical protein
MNDGDLLRGALIFGKFSDYINYRKHFNYLDHSMEVKPDLIFDHNSHYVELKRFEEKIIFGRTLAYNEKRINSSLRLSNEINTYYEMIGGYFYGSTFTSVFKRLIIFTASNIYQNTADIQLSKLHVNIIFACGLYVTFLGSLLTILLSLSIYQLNFPSAPKTISKLVIWSTNF